MTVYRKRLTTTRKKKMNRRKTKKPLKRNSRRRKGGEKSIGRPVPSKAYKDKIDKEMQQKRNPQFYPKLHEMPKNTDLLNPNRIYSKDLKPLSYNNSGSPPKASDIVFR